MHIRTESLCQKHIKDIAEIEKVCFAQPWTEQGLKEELENENAVFIAAVDDTDKTVGYIGCHLILDEAYITNVAVIPEHRREGIGEKLIHELITRLKEKQAAFVTLEVRASNMPAIGLYKKFGFESVGIRHGFYDKPKEDAVLMTAVFDKKEEIQKL